MIKGGFHSTALREISLLRELNHPNIIKLLDVISDKKNLFLIFDFIPYDLKTILTKGRALKLNEIQYLVKQLLEGTNEIHSKGLFHRDLKPTNILINENLDLFIADFGLGRPFSLIRQPYTPNVS